MSSLSLFRHSVVGAALAGAAGVVCCNPFPAREVPPVDCTAADAYEFQLLDDFEVENPADCSWYTGKDDTGLVDCDHPQAIGTGGNTSDMGAAGAPGETVLCDGPRRAQAEYSCEAPVDGPRCGSEKALRLTASRNNDWGCLFGNWALANADTDASDYEGISLWARAEPGTTKSLLVLLNDKYTANVADDDGTLDTNFESACEEPPEDETVGGGSSPSPGVPGGGATTLPGYVPSENTCGNLYQARLNVTDRWQHYVLPFEVFSQDPLPNRRLEGIDRATLRGIIFRAAKDTVVDFWIDDLSLYRTR